MTTEPVSPVEADLRARWRPSPTQEAAADRYLRLHPDADVWTLHLLVNKAPMFWTTDVEVVTLDGFIVTDRAELFQMVPLLAAAYARGTAKQVTGGYTWHYRDKDGKAVWAVWDDFKCFDAEGNPTTR